MRKPLRYTYCIDYKFIQVTAFEIFSAHEKVKAEIGNFTLNQKSMEHDHTGR